MASVKKAVNDTTIPFVQLCQLLEAVSVAATKSDKLRPIEQLWSSLRAGSGEFFPFMRLLMPQLDTMRSVYGLKESKIAKFYVELLGLSDTNPDAIRLRNWKDPTKNSTEATSLSDVIYVSLVKRGFATTSAATSLTACDVNSKLDALCLASSQDEKKSVFMSLLRETSAMEQKWIIRVIMKELKVHLSHTSILAAFHPSAIELFNTTNDLEYVCRTCTDEKELIAAAGGAAGLLDGKKGQGLFLMQPFKPMLASVVNSDKLNILLKDERMLIEPKFDGERMMIHVSPDRIMYWTRNAKNYSPLYGAKFDAVLRASIKPGVTSTILDGEFLLYDGVAKKFKEFGKNRTFATSVRRPFPAFDKMAWGAGGDGAAAGEDELDDGSAWFCYEVFDVLFLNGESLLNHPLESRQKLIHSVISEQPNKVEIVRSSPVASPGEILAQLEQALQHGHEGIMLKLARSTYTPGERKLKWMKLKPDHIAGMADTLDLIVLGGYYGTKYGMRHVSHFLLGVWDNTTSDTPLSSSAKFHTFTKVGTGYSEEELKEIQQQLDTKWITLPVGTVPPWLDDWKPAAGELPNLYIHPKDSLVLEVFGYSFTETKKFKVGQTLRFPRCHRIRLDKSIGDATDLSQLRSIMAASHTKYSHGAKKLGTTTSSAFEGDLIMVNAAKKARKANDAKAVLAAQSLPRRTIAFVSNGVAVPTITSDQLISTMLAGCECCVLYASPDVLDKASLERLLLEHGARVVGNPQKTTQIILATCRTAPKVQNWINACTADQAMEDRYTSTNVVHVSWLLSSVRQRKVMPLTPQNVLYVSRSLAKAFAATLDPFEDSFYDDCSEETFLASVEAVAKATAFTEMAAPAAQHASSSPSRHHEEGDGGTFFAFDTVSREVVRLRRQLFQEAEAASIIVVPTIDSSSHVLFGQSAVKNAGCDGRPQSKLDSQALVDACVMAAGSSSVTGARSVTHEGEAGDAPRAQKRQRIEVLVCPKDQVTFKQWELTMRMFVGGGCSVGTSIRTATHGVDSLGFLSELQ